MVVIIFIIAAIITPPDVISQIMVSLPMLLLYEISVLVAKMVWKKPVVEE
jgi:sec-independent protein translocase protein TatC